MQHPAVETIETARWSSIDGTTEGFSNSLWHWHIKEDEGTITITAPRLETEQGIEALTQLALTGNTCYRTHTTQDSTVFICNKAIRPLVIA